eukprot:5215618-Prymnesium_polylepis.1
MRHGQRLSGGRPQRAHNALQTRVEHPAWARVVEPEGSRVAVKRGAIVHADAPLLEVHRRVGARGGAPAEGLGHVDPHEVRRLGHDASHAGDGAQHLHGAVAVGAEVGDEAEAPRLALGVAVGGDGARVAERRADVGLAAPLEALPQPVVGHHADGEVERRDVEALGRRLEHNQPLAQPLHTLRRLARLAVAGAFGQHLAQPDLPLRARQQLEHRDEARAEGDVAPHLVGADDHAVLHAQPRDAHELGAAKAAARRVVRVAPVEQHHARVGERLLQRRPIDHELDLAIGELARRQRHRHELQPIEARGVHERRVDGRRHCHGVVWALRPPAGSAHGHVETVGDRRDPAEPRVARLLSAVRVRLQPCQHKVDELMRQVVVSEDAVASSLDDRVDDGLRTVKIHVSDPHRNHVLAPIGVARTVVLLAVAVSAPIEIPVGLRR